MTETARTMIQQRTVESDPSVSIEITRNGPDVVHGTVSLHMQSIEPNPQGKS